ncbi:MAG TPA: hypothetical protein VL860_14155, partial [Planctomycetota bacterium]|nr:hypothetical protein [Planctomycetota bacterium]
LLNDRPATGGYPKIATEIAADLPTLAQLRPGGSVRFQELSVGEAQAAAIQREELLAEIQRGCGVV